MAATYSLKVHFFSTLPVYNTKFFYNVSNALYHYNFATENTFALLFYDHVIVSETLRKVQVN